jgi:uncharacterized membrane protein HdeD (DUF308 family)
MQSRWGRRLTLTLGVLLLAFGVLEVFTHRNDTVPALLFWGLSLLGGGALVLTGARIWPRRTGPALALVVVGSLGGILATAWTLLVPVLALAVIVLAIRDASRALEAPTDGSRSGQR